MKTLIDLFINKNTQGHNCTGLKIGLKLLLVGLPYRFCVGLIATLCSFTKKCGNWHTKPILFMLIAGRFYILLLFLSYLTRKGLWCTVILMCTKCMQDGLSTFSYTQFSKVFKNNCSSIFGSNLFWCLNFEHPS